MLIVIPSAQLAQNPMLQACAIYAVFFKSVSRPPKTAAKIKNCFELFVTNLKTVSNPKAETKRKNVSTENCNKNKMQFAIVC